MRVNQHNQRRITRKKGSVLFIMAAAMIVLGGFAGLVVDAGYAAYLRRKAQAAADAGAKAASLEILAGRSSSITSAALQDTANNGFTDGSANVVVTVNHPPTSGQYSGSNSFAEVIVSKTVPTTFMSLLGVNTMNIAARAVGGGGGSGGACIYALNPTAADALLASGASTVVNASCGIVDESSNSKALEDTGGACINGTSIQVVGNYNGSCFSTTPTTGITSRGDPFAGKYTAPTPSGCTATNWHNASSSISPGTYCGGITISGGWTVTASAGTYILYGGGLTVSGGSNLSGAGVTFYNMMGSGYKPIVISGTSATSLSAPTSGAYEGLLFWDPFGSSHTQETVSGGSSVKFEGILYFPTENLVYSGGSTGSANYTILVADTLTFSGGSKLNSDYSSLSSGSLVKGAATVVE